MHNSVKGIKKEKKEEKETDTSRAPGCLLPYHVATQIRVAFFFFLSLGAMMSEHLVHPASRDYSVCWTPSDLTQVFMRLPRCLGVGCLQP